MKRNKLKLDKINDKKTEKSKTRPTSLDAVNSYNLIKNESSSKL